MKRENLLTYIARMLEELPTEKLMMIYRIALRLSE